MTATPVLTVLEGGRSELAPSSQVDWNFDSVSAVEIVAPDSYCATLLVDRAAPLFPAEIVSGTGWVVRFEQPARSGNWVVELLGVVETWLQSAPLPCAKVRHGDHDYLVRAPLEPHTAPTPWEAA